MGGGNTSNRAEEWKGEEKQVWDGREEVGDTRGPACLARIASHHITSHHITSHSVKHHKNYLGRMRVQYLAVFKILGRGVKQVAVEGISLLQVHLEKVEKYGFN